jgi:hypothetical protein
MAVKKRKSRKSGAASVRPKGLSVSSRGGKSAVAKRVGRFVLPTIIVAAILISLVFLGMSGYETATSSDFFVLKYVEVDGAVRTPVEDIRRIVAILAERPGVWNADLGEIREKLEKFPFVKVAAVSRSLPGGIRVNVTERVPAAIVHLKSSDYLVDDEGVMLAAVKEHEREFPFMLHGWDESKTEKAIPDNLARVRIYKRMLDEWRQFGLESRVKQVNLTNPREPIAIVEDSGRAIEISLARDNLGTSLKNAMDALTGKGLRVKSIDAGGVYPVIKYIEF